MTDYLLELEKRDASYASFGLRLLALFIDGIIVRLFYSAFSYFNLYFLGSISALLITTFAGILYRVIMEYKFAATLGKMAAKIKVVNFELGPPTLKDVLLRNIFGISFSIITFLLALPFIIHSSFMDFGTITLSSLFRGRSFISIANSCLILGLYITEAILVATDYKRRSLHDRIAKTFVVLR